MVIATLFTLAAASGTAFAQRGQGNGQGKGPSSKPPTHTTGKPVETPATPKEKGGGNPHKAPTTPAVTTTTSTTTTTTTVVTTTTPTSTVVKNPQLEQRLQALLPGMNVADAARGFKNWGQFVAAAHVSHNLNIPFTSLKARMTGASPMSLGQAIQALKPGGTTTVTTTTVQTEVRRAETETDEDFRVARNDRRR